MVRPNLSSFLLTFLSVSPTFFGSSDIRLDIVDVLLTLATSELSLGFSLMVLYDLVLLDDMMLRS